eukprot:4831568-Amphidinium_carterae.1
MLNRTWSTHHAVLTHANEAECRSNSALLVRAESIRRINFDHKDTLETLGELKMQPVGFQACTFQPPLLAKSRAIDKSNTPP